MGLFSQSSEMLRRWRASFTAGGHRLRGDITCVIKARDRRFAYRILHLYRQEQQLLDERLSFSADAADRGGVRAIRISLATTETLKQIIHLWGWPTISRVGRRASRAAWLIVQHSDHDHLFQRRYLDFMREAHRSDEVDPRDMAYLTDRVLIAEGRLQVYGTQVFDVRSDSVLSRMTGGALDEVLRCRERTVCPRLPLQPMPIRDPGAVDDRRRGVGLQPLSDYIRQLNQCSCLTSEGE